MIARVFVVAVCLAGASLALSAAREAEVVPQREALGLFPWRLAGWNGSPGATLDDQVLEVLGADEYLNRAYMAGDRAGLGLFVAYYGSQRQGDTLHSPLNCLPGAGWMPDDTRQLEVSVPCGNQATHTPCTARVNRVVISKGLERQLVLYWYHGRGRIVANEYASKVFMVIDSIRRNRTDGALVRVVSPIETDKEDGEAAAERAAIAFVGHALPLLDRFLPS